MRTRWDHGRRSSTTFSTVTIAPRRAASAPHTPSSSGGCDRDVARAGRRPARAAIATSGVERREQPDLAERCPTRVVGVVRLHRRAGDRARRDGRQTLAASGFEPLREREERPVLDLDVAAIGTPLANHRVRREVRERVARVAGDHPLDEPAAEEQRAQAREAEHHQREAAGPSPTTAARPRGPRPSNACGRRRGGARRPRARAPATASCSDVTLSVLIMTLASLAGIWRCSDAKTGLSGAVEHEVGEALALPALVAEHARRSASPACSKSARRSPT